MLRITQNPFLRTLDYREVELLETQKNTLSAFKPKRNIKKQARIPNAFTNISAKFSLMLVNHSNNGSIHKVEYSDGEQS